MTEPRTRYTRAMDVGPFEDKIGFTMTFEDGCEHFLFSRAVARDLALKLLHVIDQVPSPPAPRALGISVSEDISAKEKLG